MRQTIRRITLGALAVGAVVTLVGCAPSAASTEADLERIKMAVLSSTTTVSDAGVSNSVVSDGLDAPIRYVVVGVQVDGDTLEPNDLTAVLIAVGETVPSEFDRVEFAARDSAGGRLPLDAVFDEVEVPGAYVVDSIRAMIPTTALQEFAAAH